MWQKRLVVAISIGLGLTQSKLVDAQSLSATPKVALNDEQASSSSKNTTEKNTEKSVKNSNVSSNEKELKKTKVDKKILKTKTNSTSLNRFSSKEEEQRAPVVSTAQSVSGLEKPKNSNTSKEKLSSKKEKDNASQITAPKTGKKNDSSDSSPSSLEKSQNSQKSYKFLAELFVNGQDKGTQFFLFEKGRVLLDVKAFANAIGKAKPYVLGEPGVQKVKENLFVDPEQAIQGAIVHNDLQKGNVKITLPGAAFSSQKVYLNRFAPIPPVSSNPSAFMNYSLGTAEKTVNSFYTNGGVAWGTSSITTSYNWTPSMHWQRGLTSFQHDDIKHMRRWTIGDQYVFSRDGLGGTTGIAGIGVTRAFDLNPYLITIPQPQISGVLQAPGTLEIYKNGILVATRAVNAGPFNLENLGVGLGATNLQVVVRDPFGGTQTISRNFYAVQNTLGEGLSEFSYQLGIESPQPGLIYEPHRPAFLATQRWGLKHGLTLGYRVEGEIGLANAGGSLDWGNHWGGIHLADAVSHSTTAGQGWASNFAYNFTGRRFSFALGGSVYSKSYRKLGDGDAEYLLKSNLLNFNPLTSSLIPPVSSTSNPDAVGSNLNFLNPVSNAVLSPNQYTQEIINHILSSQRPRLQTYANIGYTPFRKMMIQASYSKTLFDDGHISKMESVGVSYDLHWASLYAGFNKSHLGQFRDKSVIFNLTIPLGQTIFTGSRLLQKNSITNTIDAQKSLPTGPGYGYTVHLQNDSQSGTQGGFELDGQNNIGRASFQYFKLPVASTYMGQLSGSVVFIGDEVHLGRPLTGSYALVNVGEDIKGVPVQHENQTIGKTHSSGSILITNMLPYQSNQVGFTQSAIPPDYVVSKTEKTISVPRFGGAVVKFHVHKLRAVRGVLKNEQGQGLSGGTITDLISVKGVSQKLDSPMGTKGNFYLDNVPVGDYTIQAKQAGKLYRCPIIVPAHKMPIYNLKSVACKVFVYQKSKK